MKNLKRLTGFIVMAFAAAWASSAAAQTTGVRDTPHNLSSRFAGDNDEVCVYCHTPHGANTAAAAPLWNKVIPAGLTFQTYDSSTLDAQLAPAGAGAPNGIGSVSIACLTCHEGTQGMDVVINAPGSGRYNPAGVDMDPATAGTMSDIFGADNIRVIGSDLRNDHPISIEYAGFTRTGGTGKIDADFVTPTKQTGADRWWVDTTVTGSTANRDKTDMVLYTRAAAGGANEPFVECASCHDPHTAANPTFLRISNSASAVCLACHVK